MNHEDIHDMERGVTIVLRAWKREGEPGGEDGLVNRLCERFPHVPRKEIIQADQFAKGSTSYSLDVAHRLKEPLATTKEKA